MNKFSVIFPGQGSQVVGMGLDLYENHEKAKEVFNIVDEVLSQKPVSYTHLTLPTTVIV